MKCHSKAESAALNVKNIKVARLNDFYLYHKDIIDEFLRLQKEIGEAYSNLTTAQINTLYDKFPPKTHRQ